MIIDLNNMYAEISKFGYREKVKIDGYVIDNTITVFESGDTSRTFYKENVIIFNAIK